MVVYRITNADAFKFGFAAGPGRGVAGVEGHGKPLGVAAESTFEKTEQPHSGSFESPRSDGPGQ